MRRYSLVTWAVAVLMFGLVISNNAQQIPASQDLSGPRVFDVSGGHALFLSEPLQRCHRDAQAVAHRARLMLETVGPAYGRVALSTPPA